MLGFVHYLHLVTGIIWAGGFVVWSLIIFPALAQQPAETAGRLWESMLGPTTVLIAGSVVLVLGIPSAVLGGKLTSFSQMGSAYGLTLSAAVALWLFLEAYGGRYRAEFRRMAAEPVRFAADAPAAAHQHAIVTTACLVVLIALMALIGLGAV